MSSRLLSASLLAVVFVAPSALARTWDVPAEIPAIQAAIDSSADGDTVAVDAGTYFERLAVTGKNLTLLGVQGPGATFLLGAGLVGDTLSILTLANVDPVTVIEGFTFQDNGADSLRELYGGAIECDSGAAPTIQGNVFRWNFAGRGGAIALTLPFAPGCTIRENTFYENGAYQGGGIYIDGGIGDSVLVENNIFERNVALGRNQSIGTGGGILVWESGVSVIRSNVFYRNEAGYAGAASFEALGGEALFENNSLALNRSTRIESFRPAGLRVYGGNSTIVTIRNNIVAFSLNGWGISVAGTAAGSPKVNLDCNDFWMNSLGDYSIVNASVTLGPGEFSADPFYCNPFNGDLTLYDFSPCLPESTGTCGLVGALGVGCSGILDSGDPTQAHGLVLAPPHPNPASPRTTVSYSLTHPGSVKLTVHDVQGRLVTTLVDSPQAAGPHEAVWDGGSTASGLYFIRMAAADVVRTQRVLLVR